MSASPSAAPSRTGDLRVAGGEVVVPEQRHLLLERAVACAPCGTATAAARRVMLDCGENAPFDRRAGVARLADRTVDIVDDAARS